jgi:RHS repeat-associated protein
VVLRSETNGRGYTTEYQYDELNRQIETIDADSNHTHTQYFDTPTTVNTVLAELPLGLAAALTNSTYTLYDRFERQIATYDATKHQTSALEYDAVDRILESTDTYGQITSYSYLDSQRKQVTIDSFAGITTAQYDIAGNLTDSTDSFNRTTHYKYDQRNRQTLITDAAGGTTKYTYYVDNKTKTITDSVDNTTTYLYDIAGRPIIESTAQGDRVSKYDKVNNRTQSTDRNGRTINYTYDNLNRTKSEQWVNGNKTFTYTYDNNSNLLSTQDNSIRYEYTYDRTDLLETVTRTSTNGTTSPVTFKYSYDEVGNLTQTDELIANNITATTIYKYADPRYLNTEIIQTGTGLTSKTIKFTYDTNTGDNTKIDRYLNGLLVLSTTNAYDTHGRLKGITQRNSTGIIAQSTYALDNLNRLISTSKNGQTQTYDYDSTDQVKTVTGSHSEAYTYDKNGNRTSGGYVTDAGNRLRSDGTYRYEYDSEGNRISRTKLADGTVDTYRWDYRNRLMGIVSTDLDGVVTRSVGYTYDVDDLRVSKTVDGVVENYYLDGEQIAFVTDGGGNETFHYLYGLNVDQVLAQDSETGMIWALADRLGSVDTLTDADGNVVESRTYDSFGNLLSTTANSTLPTPNFRYGYTGRELDAESGLDYYRARYYDSKVGRFVSVDPMGFGAGDTNLYRYVGNNSTNATDPSGMISWNDIQQGAANISQTVQDAAYGWLVNTDKAYAGFAGFVTGGYTDRLRNEVYGDKVAGQNEGWIYNLGQVAGFGVTAVLSFLAPGALVGRISAAERVAQGYTVAQTGIGAFNTTTKIQDGQMDWSSPWSYVETAASYTPLFGATARQFGKIGVVENTLSKATSVAGDIWNGVGSKLGKLNQKVGELFSATKTFTDDLFRGADLVPANGALSRLNRTDQTVTEQLNNLFKSAKSNLEVARNTFIEHFGKIGVRSDDKIIESATLNRIQSIVQNRIIIRQGRSDLSKSNKGSGLQYALGNHMNPSKLHKSQFTITQEELIEILGNSDVIKSPVRTSISYEEILKMSSKALKANTKLKPNTFSYVREVDLGYNIGLVPVKNSLGQVIDLKLTSVMTIYTDGFGNLKNVYPGNMSY